MFAELAQFSSCTFCDVEVLGKLVSVLFIVGVSQEIFS